jgi:HEXXH motif-containing protein
MSHNKLNALFERESVLDNAFTPLFASPVRPDPRPLHGVLLAVHAFLPVARLYERMIEAGHPFAADRGFLRRYRDIVEKNTEAAETLLAHGRFTNAGEPLAQEIRAWDRHFRRA